MNRFRLLMIAVLTTAAMLQAGSDPAIEKQVRQAEAEWVKAVTSGDQKGVAALAADDLIYTHSDSRTETKDEYLKSLASGQVYKSIEAQDATVRTFGNAAVYAARVRMTGTNKTGPFDNNLRVLHVWVKQGGRWQLAAHQTTRITQ